MKKIVIALFALLLMHVATPASANPAFIPKGWVLPADVSMLNCDDGHWVTPGEDLWTDAARGLKVPDTAEYSFVIRAEVSRIESQNKGIDWEGRTKPDMRFPGQGRDIVFIGVNECIHGLHLPNHVMHRLAQKPIDPVETTPQVKAPPTTEVKDELSGWLPWILILLLLAFLFALGIQRDKATDNLREEREKRERLEEIAKDPVTSGPPQVPGGVSEQEAPARALEIAALRTGTSAVRMEIVRQTAGRIWGVNNVSYGDGTNEDRRHHGEVAYETVVRLQDRSEQTFYFLSRCGNEVRYGNVTEHQPGDEFRFVPDAQIIPAPEPQPAPAPVPTSEAPAATSEEGSEPNLDGVEYFAQFQVQRNGKDARLMGKGVGELAVSRRNSGVYAVTFKIDDK